MSMRRRLGRRGQALLAFAVLDATLGVRLLTAKPSDGPIYAWLNQCGSLWPWALPWLVVAACCLADAFRDRDRVAFTAAIGIKVLWASLYFTGWLLGDVEDGWISSAVWGTFGICVWLIAGWPEPINGEGRPAWTPPLD